MDLQNEERDTGIRRIPKCVGFNKPTKDDRAPGLPPDPARPGPAWPGLSAGEFKAAI